MGRVGILPPTLIVDHTPQEVTLDGVSYTGFVADLKSNQFIRHNIPNIVGGYTDLRNDQLYLVDTSQDVLEVKVATGSLKPLIS